VARSGTVPAMSGPVVLCTDGSEAALAALAAGLDLLGPARDLVLVTVVEPEDPTLVTGAGFQGSVMTPEEFEAMASSRRGAARDVLAVTARSLGLDLDGSDSTAPPGAPTVRAEVLEGGVGDAICDYATNQGAAAIVVGTRGRRGLRRALLGSVSDHVIRHAPCPVVISDAPS
jgi:nucleotide-binding universal stress UspA family protein